MKKKSLCIVIALVLMTAMCLGACGEKEEPKDEYQTSVTSDLSMAQDVKDYLDKVDTKYMYEMTKTLAYDEKYWDNELGWRTAGSDAEHACADYLVAQMKDIGLEDVEKSGVPVDKFQFNDSSLTIADTKIDLTPASYQCSGTDDDGLTAEIVDCNTGFESDYEGIDVNGKIVLAGVDQSNEAWIDGYIRQAHEKGAAAIVTYSYGGYGELNNDTINVQDICCEDLIPTVAISNNQAKKIQKAIKNGNSDATLKVDVDFEPGEGTSYNVIGKIPGKSSDQQIVVSGHYDKYWFGFQDDCAAIGLIFTMAKAMQDSGYEPENDIVFVCHGAEEWGSTDTQFDWTTGAWGNINEVNTDWASKTLAMFNFELPAYEDGTNTLAVTSVPEFSSSVKKIVKDSGLIVKAGDIKKVKHKSIDSDTMEDGVSYRWAGVPYFVNSFQGEKFMHEIYHTAEDNKGTWNKGVAKTNLNLHGAMVIYTDKTPALELDMTATCDDLDEALDTKLAKEADADADAFTAAAKDLRTAAEAYNEKIKDINDRYEAAVADEASAEDIQAIRDEGKEINEQTLEAFKYIQDNLIAVDTWGLHIKNAGINDNITWLQSVIKGLENKELFAEDEESGALDAAWNINAVLDYNYFIFSKDVATDILDQYDPDKVSSDKTFWVTDRLIPVCYVGETTYDLIQQSEKPEDVDFDAAIAVYQEALDKCYADLKAYLEGEVEGMKGLAEML